MAKSKTGAEQAKHPNIAEITHLVDEFCKAYLNEEYADLSRRLTEKLARKRPSPLVSGKPNTWACAIVRTIGWVNFLSDKSPKPYMRTADIDQVFGVSESTSQAKSMQIRKMLKIHQMDPQWSLPSQIDRNPMVWMIQVNGLIIDARFLRREIQEEAYRNGLIPYIPERPRPSGENEGR